MKRRLPRAVTMLTLLLIGCGQAATPVATASQQEPPLRLAEPVDDVIADLKHYIPERMREADVPGLAIALIRDGEVAWTEGFGLANTITGQPVTPETVFEVGSNSKVVTAYTALRFVEQGRLSLDEPVSAHLSEPWLPPSEYGDRITLRHLASHSSGLADNSDSLITVDKSIAFKPGSSFYYSGIGALYMQEAIEQVTGKSLEAVAREVVFEPLGMSSSSFVNSAAVKPHMANGHIDYRLPLLFFMVPFIAILIGISLLGILVLRVCTGKWSPTWEMMAGACVVAAILTVLMFALRMGRDLPNYVLLVALCAAAFAVAFAVTFFIGRQIVAWLPTAWHGRISPRALQVIWAVMSVFVLLWLSGRITVQVPKGLSPHPSAIGTLRASAPDLAAFLIELADPQHLSKDMAAQIRTPQVSISRDMSWGLGPGIQHGEQGDALWQNGQTFGFRSVMVIYPEYGMGVVVLTNSDHGFPVVFDVAQRAIGGSAIRSIIAFLA